MGKLEGKVAIVTGAAQGQGAAEAKLFVEEGACVLIADIQEESARQLAAKLGTSALACRLDVGESEDWAQAVSFVEARFGKVDILVNNAAVFHVGAIEDTSVADYMRVIRVNQLGPWLGMQHVLPSMRAAGGGTIVNVASMAGLVPAAKVGAYASSKGAVRTMSRVAAAEFAPYGVRVNTIFSGAVNTAMSLASTLSEEERRKLYAHLPIPRQGTVEEVAKMILFLASEDSSYCTGSEFVIDGGALATLHVPALPK